MEVTKGYETIPPYDQVKLEVIRRLVILSDEAAKTQALIYIGRNDPMTLFQFLSDTLNFYQFLRPKMAEYVNSKGDKHFLNFMKMMDNFSMHPLKFTPKQAIMAYININDFCEKYKLTSTTMYTGFASRSIDVYSA